MSNPPTAKTIPTTSFLDQRPGTSGLRKRTKVFTQPHYLENFVQSVFDVIRETNGGDLSGELLVVGGDGRYFNRRAIQTILRIAAGNGFGSVLIGCGGLLSTPAMSATIRRRGALGGLVLSASHNPGGPEADFGVKYNIRNGGPAPEPITERIFERTRQITSYDVMETPDIDLDVEGSTTVGTTHVSVIDPLEDYMAVMESLFDFEALRVFFHRGRRLIVDAMHGVAGPYARHIFIDRLGAPEESVIRGNPLEDFGGLHPDPNLVHAAELVRRMSGPDSANLGAACDGDADRNLILGENIFVTPGDSLAVITERAQKVIPGYRAGLKGVARSMPTSTAVDRVAQALRIPCYETPTGWKFFGNLMDAGRCTICGEESFGTGSDHVREKDGIWAILCWLAILTTTGQSVAEVIQRHWQRFGRSYYQRYDYEGLDSQRAKDMLDALEKKLPSLTGSSLAGSSVQLADNFSYTDPVDGTVSTRQGIRIVLADGSRLVTRLSGTGTEGATLRLYVECFRRDAVNDPIDRVLTPYVDVAIRLLDLPTYCGRDKATVIT